MEPYLQCNIIRDLTTAFTKVRLCSHKLYILVDMGLWVSINIKECVRCVS